MDNKTMDGNSRSLSRYGPNHRYRPLGIRN